MYNKQLKKIALLLIIGSFAVTSSAQTVSLLKIGENPYTINDKAALEVESTTRGFLLPRMTKQQRDAIPTTLPVGLQVWCTDCDGTTVPASGQLCVYMGAYWAPIQLVVPSCSLTTGKKSDTDPPAPVRVSATSATISGKLVEVSTNLPTETGIVWKEIIGTDFASLPFLDALGTATAPVYKTSTASVVTTAGATISQNIPTLTSSTGNTSPYYFRTYAKTAVGIEYGNPVVFNCAPPILTTATVTGGATLYPTFAGTLTVNAGTPQSTITEYGYYSGQTDPPTNKMVLSTTASLTSLNTLLNTETFTANPTVNLAVNNYEVLALGTTYFRYYVIASGVPVYSNTLNFVPAADYTITGGTASATVSLGLISMPFVSGVTSSSTIPVTFNVLKTGTYLSFTNTVLGATTGLTLSTVPAGTFTTTGKQIINFTITGTAASSIAGNSFTVSRIIPTFNTGFIRTSLGAICDGTHPTVIASITSPTTGRIWMDRNLGAVRAAVSANDYLAYGCLYQWGRGNDGHANVTWTSGTAGTFSATTALLSASDVPGNTSFITSSGDGDWHSPKKDQLWQGISGINNPCPSADGYRVPTSTELTAEATALSITNLATAYSSILKLTSSGERRSNGLYVGNSGNYWSSTISTFKANDFYITSNSALLYTDFRGVGYAVRCIKKLPTE